jgi:cell division protein FtsA
VLAALDVGTSKVAALIAAIDGDGSLRLIGEGMRACNGLRRGLVVDMARTEAAIRAAMQQAEQMAGLEIDTVIVNLSAGGLESAVITAGQQVAGERVTDTDVSALLADARSRIDEQFGRHGRATLHAEPTLYTVDGLDGVTNPEGFHAEQLQVDVHVVTAATPPCRNLDLVVRNAHLGVGGIIASGVAASAAVLNAEERELGVALVEIGAGVTTVCAHGGGMLAGLVTIPIGAGDITNAIASHFGTRRAAAERLKVLNGAAAAVPRDSHDLLDLPPLDPADGEELRRVSRADLIAVIRARLDPLFAEIGQALDDLGFDRSVGRQVVLAGGGAELRGIAEFAQSALGRNVRIGRPRGIAGLGDNHGPRWASLAGMILFANTPRLDLARVAPRARGRVAPPQSRSPFVRLFNQLRRQI